MVKEMSFDKVGVAIIWLCLHPAFFSRRLSSQNFYKSGLHDRFRADNLFECYEGHENINRGGWSSIHFPILRPDE